MDANQEQERTSALTRSASAATYPAPDVGPIYVEASSLLNKRLTGIGRFVARLLEALTRRTSVRLVTTIQAEQARSLKLSTAFLCGQEITLTTADLPAADHDVGLWARRLLRRPRCRHDLQVSSRYPGLYTMLRPPERHFRRELCLLYDFTPLTVPWAHTADTRESYGIFFAESSGLCDKAVAISQSTKADARSLCALPEKDVVVGYPGPSLCVQAHAHPEPVRRRDNVILVVSTLEPRKNTRFLLDWFLDTQVLAPSMELWWVGPPGWLCDRFRRLRRRAQGRQLRFLGMVTDRSLCEAYQQAAFTIYPSLYEGFGFPVLDSLWHGAPVLSSFNSSLQEFAGPGVFYFDACDPASLDEAYRQFMGSRPVAIDREALRAKFSWDVLARTVVNLCA
jgi:glycosyltransferase involved in cell wall biosynthesis